MNEIILMAHVFFGVACLLTALWVFVDALNFSGTSQVRIRKMSIASAVFMWISFLFAGYWYVVFYKADKNIILNGPFPSAHSFFMETKEHLVILLLMLATYLPVVTLGNSPMNRDSRRLVLWVAGLIVMLALLMEGHGAIIAMGVKAGLLSR